MGREGEIMNLRLFVTLAAGLSGLAVFPALAGNEPRHTRNCLPLKLGYVKLYGETAARPDLWGCRGALTKKVRLGIPYGLEDLGFYSQTAAADYRALVSHVAAICSDPIVMVRFDFSTNMSAGLATWEMDVLCMDKEWRLNGR
jgi:hypothetical protein